MNCILCNRDNISTNGCTPNAAWRSEGIIHPRVPSKSPGRCPGCNVANMQLHHLMPDIGDICTYEEVPIDAGVLVRDTCIVGIVLRDIDDTYSRFFSMSVLHDLHKKLWIAVADGVERGEWLASSAVTRDFQWRGACVACEVGKQVAMSLSLGKERDCDFCPITDCSKISRQNIRDAEWRELCLVCR